MSDGLSIRTDYLNQYQRYRETLVWVATGLFRFDRSNTLLAILLNVTGGLLRTGALALLLYYASFMERGVEVTLYGTSLDPRSEGVFYLAIVIALLLLICGALAVYFGKHINTRLTLAFATYCSKTIMCTDGGRPPRNPDPADEACHASTRSGVTDIIGLSRGIKPVLQVSNPVANLFYSVGVLFYLNSLVTLTVLLLALASLLFQYRVNFNSVQNEAALIKSRRAGKRWLTSLFDSLVLTPRIYPSRAAWIDRQYQQSSIHESLHRYYQRVLAQPRSALVGDLLLAILLFLIVAYLGSQALAGDIGWTRFIAYLLFARISLLAFRGMLVSITGFARHYPRVRRIYEFNHSLQTSSDTVANSWMVNRYGADTIGNRKTLKFSTGTPLCILTQVPLTRFNLYAFVDVIAGRKVQASNDLRAQTFCLSRGVKAMPGGSVNEMLAGAALTDTDDLQSALAAIPGKQDELLSPDDWGGLPIETRARLLLEQAGSAAACMVMVDARVLARCGDACAQQWLASMQDKLVVVISGNTGAIQHGEYCDVVLFAADRSVSIATAAWCLDNAAQVDAWFSTHVSEPDSDLDDEDIEDE